jgi:ribose transport system permease protein
VLRFSNRLPRPADGSAPAGPRGAAGLLSTPGRARVVGVYIATALLWAVAAVTLGHFTDVWPILQSAAFLGVVAAGQTVVILAAGIDLSVSMVVSVAAVSVSLFTGPDHLSAGPAILATLGLCAVVGVANGAGVHFLKVNPMVMTLGTLSILEGAFLLYTNGQVSSGHSPLLHELGSGTAGNIPVAVLVWLAVSAITLAVLRLTRFGRGIYAIGSNAAAARLSGVRTGWTTIGAYVYCALLAGVAGLLLFGFAGQGYMDLGDPYQLNSIAAVVVGGTSILGGRGSYLGTIGGAILLSLLAAVLTSMNFGAGVRDIVAGSIILALVTLYAREGRD